MAITTVQRSLLDFCVCIELHKLWVCSKGMCTEDLPVSNVGYGTIIITSINTYTILQVSSSHSTKKNRNTVVQCNEVAKYHGC